MALQEGMKVYTDNGEICARFYTVKREGDKLVVDGKALDTMRMDMIFTSEEMFKGIRMALNWDVISFVLLLPYFYIKNLMKKGDSV